MIMNNRILLLLSFLFFWKIGFSLEDQSPTLEDSPNNLTEYCESSSDFPWEDWIAGVSIGSIENHSGKSVYSDFTYLSSDLTVGASTPIELTTGYSWYTWDEYWTVWIDYNQDGILESPIEIAYRGIKNAPANGSSSATLLGNLEIPSWALSGQTRMRISMTRDTFSTSCQMLEFGEVEDYTVNIQAAESTGADLELTAFATPTSLQNGLAEFIITLTNNGPETATNISVKQTKNPHLYAFENIETSQGSFSFGTLIWEISSLQSGQTAVLNYDGWFIDMETPQTEFFELTAAFPDDPDSTPNNDNGAKTADEDDEAVIYFTPSNPADLIVTSLAAPDNAEQGTSFDVNFNLLNIGGLNAPSSVTAVYLSSDNQLDASDAQVGEANPTGVGPGFMQSQIISVEIPQNQTLGFYYLLTVADADNEIFEASENNNIEVRTIEITGDTITDYCESTSDFPWEDWISHVKAGSLDLTSGKSTYSDFTNFSTDLQAGTSIPIELTTGYSWYTWDEYWTVWIDYNQDGILESPIEIAYRGIKTAPANGTSSTILFGNLGIPSWALSGQTRMRVSMSRNDFSVSCQTLDFGEVEDYTVNILPPTSPQNRMVSFRPFKVDNRVDLYGVFNLEEEISDILIERSVDGNDFFQLETNEGEGVFPATNYINVHDERPNEGWNFYRPVFRFENGNKIYGESRQIFFQSPETFQLFPNPAQESVNISLKNLQDTKIEIQLINQFGKVIENFRIDQVSEGVFRLPLDGLMNGFYQVWIFAEGQRAIGKKLIVSKL